MFLSFIPGFSSFIVACPIMHALMDELFGARVVKGAQDDAQVYCVDIYDQNKFNKNKQTKSSAPRALAVVLIIQTAQCFNIRVSSLKKGVSPVLGLVSGKRVRWEFTVLPSSLHPLTD